MTSFIIMSVALTAVVAVFLVSFALTVSKLRIELPANNPEAWLAARGKPTSSPPRARPLVVCAGDSLTHGAVSVNWVDMMSSRIPDADFVNAGVNTELAYNLYQRLDPVVALDPDFVIVLIGTNDANATLGMKSVWGYMATQRLPEVPSPQFYREILTLIVRRLKAETKASIALTSIPPIGEDSKHYAWLRSEEYATIVKETAFSENVDFLPLHERLTAYLQGAPAKKSIAFGEFTHALSQAHWDRTMFGKTWDEISARNGFHLLIDGIHLNTHGAIMMADLAERFIRDGRRAERAREPAARA